ncbi:MAG: hypothetical protein J0H98_08235 [Solirubrobacterales bacterium]|nr:hypothetical protein [Solirubrobacterales bacterium]
MDNLVSAFMVVGFGCLGVALICVFAAGVEAITRRPEPPRPHETPCDLAEATQDFFGGNGQTRLAVALARENNEPRAATTAGALTGKETTHARLTH